MPKKKAGPDDGGVLGRKVAAARQRQGSTQQEIADRLGVHWISISKLERGKISMTREWAERFASVLPIDFNEIDPQRGRRSGYIISGNLGDSGDVKFSEDQRVFDDVEYLNAKGRWFQINSHMYKPNLHKGDIVRISDVKDIDPFQHAQGRFCLAKDLNTGETVFGLYDQAYYMMHVDISIGFKPAVVRPKPYGGVLVTDMPFEILGVVSSIVIPAIRPDLNGHGKTVFYE